MVLAVAMLAGIGLAALAWRLQEGPLPLPMLARELEKAFDTGRDGARLQIGEVAIAWAGWREGQRSPIELTMRQVEAIGADGVMHADLPDATLSLSPAWLLRGVLAPRALTVSGLTLRATRSEDGTLSLDLRRGDTEAAAAGEEPPAGEASPLLDLAAQLMRPPSDDAPLSALRSVRLSDTRLIVVDRQLGRSWTAEIDALALTRRAGGGIDLAGSGGLALGAERLGLRVAGTIDGATGRGRATVTVPTVRPAALARNAPRLAPLAMIDAPATLAVDVQLDGLRIPSMALARLRIGPGAIDLGAKGRIALASLEADVTLEEETLRIERAVLHPAQPSVLRAAAAAPTITGQAEARRAGAQWRIEAQFGLDQVAAADLGFYWPAGIARGAREWLTENLTDGVARDGNWRLTATVDPATGAFALASLDGTLDAEGLEVHWLRPIPPAAHANGRARFGLDAIEIDLTGGNQSGTAIEVREGKVRIGFTTDPEIAEIELVVGGPAADVWALLRQPRLGLFRSRPPPVDSVTGTLREGRLSLGFPMIAELPIEAMRISATGRAADIRIPRLVLGKDLERGAFDFTADPQGLRVNGTATVQGIAVRIQQTADFRNGPANQVVSRETVTGRAEVGQIAAFGLDPRPFVTGAVGLDIRNETRRNGQGRVQLRTDLRDARLSIDALAWAKPPGVAGQGEATFVLANGQLTAIDGIRVETADAQMRGRGTQLRRNMPRRIEIQQAHLGRSRFSGELVPPEGPGGDWTIAMRGPVLDIAPVLARSGSAAEGEAGGDDGAGVSLEAHFDRVLLQGDAALSGITATLGVNGRGLLAAAQVRGRVVGGGSLDLSVAPQLGRRRLRLTSDNGGALLRAFGVLRTIQGGRLSVDATYAHDRSGAPLAGTAELEEFAVENAPAVGKLLQAMSVFGVFEALSGQGLTFASLTAPFTLTPEALVLDDARAFSMSLGLTARGRIDRRRDAIDMEGTIVPAYVFNSLLGRIPLLGRIFSPEQGGGLFAATYRIRGPLADPAVSVNPLAALTPGFLRGIFGIGQDSATDAPPQPGRR
ncbi:AsmA-like C-terminal region-containing protein [Roseomonas sp. HJA6]|uniref:AsmA-like C-terminal region-containing protein n=2 Tax=Roseomonas alba TaxID=2846776 RepID=A0ABS7A2R5_9PROT|nr:AsmA-like C-terminal region-containing protein [Neoroseomonas alba]